MTVSGDCQSTVIPTFIFERVVCPYKIRPPLSLEADVELLVLDIVESSQVKEVTARSILGFTAPLRGRKSTMHSALRFQRKFPKGPNAQDLKIAALGEP